MYIMIITLVCRLDLWIYPKAVLLLLIMFKMIYLFTHANQQVGGDSRFFLSQQHCLDLSANSDSPAVLCSVFVSLFCNCVFPFVLLILSPDCTLCFSVFISFIFSDFKTILLCHHFITLVS